MNISEDFLEDYRDAVDDVLGAGYQTYEMKLSNFYSTLKSEGLVWSFLKNISNQEKFQAWYDKAKSDKSGMVGSGSLNFSTDRCERVSQQFWLFKYMSENQGEYTNFCLNFLYTDSKLDSMVYAINSQIFSPFSRDLLKTLQRKRDNKGGDERRRNSDEIIRLDQSASELKKIKSEICTIRESLEVHNSLSAEFPEEKNRVLAELTAANILLEQERLNIIPFKALISSALLWLLSKVGEKFAGIIITGLLIVIGAVLGISIPGL